MRHMAPSDCVRNGCDVIRIVIAHGNAMVVELLAAAVEKQSRFRVVARVSSVMDVAEAMLSKDVDVALISANLRDGPLSGFHALQQIYDCHPEVRTVILLDEQKAHLVLSAFRLGVKGIFSTSESEFEMLCRCVERVHEGQIWANSLQMGQAVEALAQPAPSLPVNHDRLNLLTKREKDVVRLLAEGFTNRDVARELNLSEHTIKNYIFRMFDKAGVSNRVELVLYAVSSAKDVRIDRAKEHQEDIEVSDDSTVQKLRPRSSNDVPCSGMYGTLPPRSARR